MKSKEIEIRTQLLQCTGSEAKFYQPLFKDVFYTDGVRAMYILCDAHWLLLDMISSIKLARKPEFLHIKLFRKENETNCFVDYEDGNGNLIKKVNYPYTTFPLSNTIKDNKVLPAIDFFFQNDMLYLPSEH